MSNLMNDNENMDDNDADKVRDAIIRRYDRGTEGPIEEWEDASFIIYQVCDRYGFLHKNPLPHVERDERLLEIERERASKWLKMLENWDKYMGSDKLRRRIFKGIPDIVRGEAWKKLLGVDKTMNERAGIYEKFRLLARSSSPDIRQIDLDVNRTYRDHIMFRERFSVKQQALFHVLAAYSMYNVEVGYCQGMSGIAAVLLMYMNEEDSFWALSTLLTDKKHHMHGFFTPGFPKLMRFQSHHDKILKKTMPKLQKHLEQEGCYTSLYTLKWFMQCYLDRLPFSLVLRLYDVFLLEGDRILFTMAYGIMKLHKRQFLRMGLEELAPYLQETMPNELMYSDDEMIDLLQESINELRKAKLDPPPPPGKDESPQIIPGTVFERGNNLSASKRARMFARNRKNTIEVPIGRPESPKNTSHDVPGQESRQHSSEISSHPRNSDSSHVSSTTPTERKYRGSRAAEVRSFSSASNVKGEVVESRIHPINDIHENGSRSRHDNANEKRLSDYDNTTTAFNFEINEAQHERREQTIQSHKVTAHQESNATKKKVGSAKFYLNNEPTLTGYSELKSGKTRSPMIDSSPAQHIASHNDIAANSQKIALNEPESPPHTPHSPPSRKVSPNELSHVNKRNPPPYRPKRVPHDSSNPGSFPENDHSLESPRRKPQHKKYTVSAHTIEDSYWDRGRRQPPPYPSEKLTPVEKVGIEEESWSYGVSIQPITREKHRTLPKGVPVTNEAKYNIIDL